MGITWFSKKKRIKRQIKLTFQFLIFIILGIDIIFYEFLFLFFYIFIYVNNFKDNLEYGKKIEEREIGTK
jgi:hypothetical protein